MPRLFLVGESDRRRNMPDVPTPLTLDDAAQVGGGMRKVPGGPVTTVFYDDGISVLTSDPSKSNVVVNYL